MNSIEGTLPLLLLLGACTAPAAESAPPAPHHHAPGGECRNTDFARFVGRPATSALAAEARALAGAGTVRLLKPGQVVTLEYRSDRLNISVDARNRVVRVRCG